MDLIFFNVAVTGQAFLALCAVNFGACFDFACCFFVKSGSSTHLNLLTSNYVFIFFNGSEMFPGIECQQAVVVAGTEKIRNFAWALT